MKYDIYGLWCVCLLYCCPTWNTMLYGVSLFFIDVLHEARCSMVCMSCLGISYMKHDVVWYACLVYWCLTLCCLKHDVYGVSILFNDVLHETRWCMVCISCLLMSYMKYDVYGVWCLYLVYSCPTWNTMFYGVYVLFTDVLHETRCVMECMSCLLVSYMKHDVCVFFFDVLYLTGCFMVCVSCLLKSYMRHDAIWCVCPVYWCPTWSTILMVCMSSFLMSYMKQGVYCLSVFLIDVLHKTLCYMVCVLFIDILHETRCFMECMSCLLVS
jgi:hypothetical protein